MRYKDNPEPQHNPPGADDKVMHSLLRFGEAGVMISDGNCGGRPAFQGFALTLQASDEADAKRKFSALSLGGRVEIMYRWAYVVTFGGGVNEVQRDIIATAGLGMPRSGR